MCLDTKENKMKRLILILALLIPSLVFAQSARGKWDSGSVASGAQIQSPLLDLISAKNGELQIFIDNTAGTALRALTMTVYKDDGSTVVETITLRNVAYGAAPTGSVYAPGQVRGYVGPNPPAAKSGIYTLIDVSGAVAGVLTPGWVWTEDATELFVLISAIGGAPTANYEVRVAMADSDSSSNTILQSSTMIQGGRVLSISPGSSAVPATTNTVGIPSVIPKRIDIQIGAPGAGVTNRIVVNAKGPVPGTFSVQMAIPRYVRFTLAAGGSGAARVYLFER
jgi:hypothetical protein